MTIDIKGHSGCNIDIIEKDDILYIKKSTEDLKYLKRLDLQGRKQTSDYCLTDAIKNPVVHEVVCNDNECYIIMDYIYAKNFIDYFESASNTDVDHFIEEFIKYINNEIMHSEIKEISKEIFLNKFDSVVNNCRKNLLVNSFDRTNKVLNQCCDIFNNMPDTLMLPIGCCHGDLTFSNILFTSRNFYFIDYLDSFIETPLQDIVKLRQDTKYFWSTMMYKKQYDVIRLNMIFDYIDKKIDEYYSAQDAYHYFYDYLQLMNILRILPYVKEDKVLVFVVNILESIIKQITSKNNITQEL